MVVRLDPPPNVLQMDETGTIRVAGTRITLDTLIGAYKRGDTPQEICEGFPDLGGDLFSHCLLSASSKRAGCVS